MDKMQPNSSYHIFNHANGFENIFIEPENYRYFLEKYRLYINPIAETYAYCLMPNHFHLVVRIRRREVLEDLYRKNNFLKLNNFIDSTNFSKVQNFGEVIEKLISNEELERFISKQFSNLFSCYTQSFNKVNKRRGSLFIKNFKREPIFDKEYFLNAVCYTHRNPVHHGFCTRYEDWSYSSYCEIIENKSLIVSTDKLLKTFGGIDQYIALHQQSLDKFRQFLFEDI